MAAVHRYAYVLWKKLEEKSDEDGVFRGKLVDVWASIGASQAYYSRIRGYLIQNEYIEIMEQGARGRDSVIALHTEPPEDVSAPLRPPLPVQPEPFDTLQGPQKISDVDLTGSEAFAILSRRVEAIGERVGGLNISEALLNFEKRLAHVEKLLRNGSKDA